jgi:hypothetical protein
MHKLLFILLVLSLGSPAIAQENDDPSSVAVAGDYFLLTVFLKHDQSQPLDALLKEQEKNGFTELFPPKGIEVESWYVMMGIGQVVILRVPPSRLREINRAIERSAWGSFETEFYPTYDLKEFMLGQRSNTGK